MLRRSWRCLLGAVAAWAREVHGFGFGWGVALANVHEQAELLQVVVQVVGAGDNVFAGVEENGTVVCEK